MKRMWGWCLLATWMVAGMGCATPTRSPAADGPAEWRQWQAERRESIAGTNGWLTLVGRYWLPEGAHRAGAEAGSEIALTAGRAPARMGVFVRSGRGVRFEAADGVEAYVGEARVSSVDMMSDRDGPPTRLRVGSLTFSVIERGERLGLRVRDPGAPERVGFSGLRYFGYEPRWRLAGRFETLPEMGELRVSDVTGNTQSLRTPGWVVFEVEGREYRLQVVEEVGEDRYFVIFRDRTAGVTTYGAGRFLYVDRADAGGRVVVDFNYAYTPPCAFTPYATCPLPPPQNELPFSIRAGERFRH